MNKLIAGLAALTLTLGVGNADARELNYNARDVKETGKAVYAEGANQPDINKRLIARTIINRAKNDNFPATPYKAIHQENAFTCTQGSKLWRQAQGKAKMKKYERGVFARCNSNVQDVYAGRSEGLAREDEIIAYHDISIPKPKGVFWDSLEEVYRKDRLIFYAPRRKD